MSHIFKSHTSKEVTTQVNVPFITLINLNPRSAISIVVVGGVGNHTDQIFNST